MFENHFFPKKFNFFNVGQISQTSTKFELFKNIAATIVFKIKGDEYGLCAVCFENLPNLTRGKVTPFSFQERNSMILELSNILVSKMVNSMAEFYDSQFEISPPLYIQHDEVKFRHLFSSIRNTLLNTAKPAKGVKVKYYEFGEKKNSIRIALIYMQSPEGQS